ncbi:glycosyltransferase [Thermus scotoductus]|uniref:Glycosyltransferase n=1 Tax=Thermus scotoductus TaxID=37636 RepID=A0A430SH56_THESC|nr:WecB/TagA/CpsF family glycosyltransferase [Thermus scotoductus]RTG93331.1 glycosyltransferase [Thermus scotoductus]RTH01194.1 glycosyltransferase [Thermus scotoductus]RTH17335.1 glycosyltransferase [Thermus scotoductus]RTH39303.1 glycosyltransferase [Thermus scotoductus]RTH97439.1 glycosyltransferase [Thermus scotoductus]
MDRLEILGLPLDPVGMEAALKRIEGFLKANTTHQVVTLNPEIAVRAQEDKALKEAIREAELITPDGVGILWAVKRLRGVALRERVTGVDLTLALLERFPGIRVYLLGGRPGVAERAALEARRLGAEVVGYHHGYFQEEEGVVEEIRQKAPDLLLVGMGERQETFIHRHKAHLRAKVAMGVGGTLDVLAGEAKRPPAWAQRLGLEWLLRVGLDPKRWKRAPRLFRFAYMVLRETR